MSKQSINQYKINVQEVNMTINMRLKLLLAMTIILVIGFAFLHLLPQHSNLIGDLIMFSLIILFAGFIFRIIYKISMILQISFKDQSKNKKIPSVWIKMLVFIIFIGLLIAKFWPIFQDMYDRISK